MCSNSPGPTLRAQGIKGHHKSVVERRPAALQQKESLHQVGQRISSLKACAQFIPASTRLHGSIKPFR
jgi:hypothetical protein